MVVPLVEYILFYFSFYPAGWFGQVKGRPIDCSLVGQLVGCFVALVPNMGFDPFQCDGLIVLAESSQAVITFHY